MTFLGTSYVTHLVLSSFFFKLVGTADAVSFPVLWSQFFAFYKFFISLLKKLYTGNRKLSANKKTLNIYYLTTAS